MFDVKIKNGKNGKNVFEKITRISEVNVYINNRLQII